MRGAMQESKAADTEPVADEEPEQADASLEQAQEAELAAVMGKPNTVLRNAYRGKS